MGFSASVLKSMKKEKKRVEIVPLQGILIAKKDRRSLFHDLCFRKFPGQCHSTLFPVDEKAGSVLIMFVLRYLRLYKLSLVKAKRLYYAFSKSLESNVVGQNRDV